MLNEDINGIGKGKALAGVNLLHTLFDFWIDPHLKGCGLRCRCDIDRAHSIHLNLSIYQKSEMSIQRHYNLGRGDLDNNWIVENLTNAFGVWTSKMTECGRC